MLQKGLETFSFFPFFRFIILLVKRMRVSRFEREKNNELKSIEQNIRGQQ